MAAKVCVASLVKPHGLQGEVVMKIFTQEPEAVLALSPLSFDDPARGLLHVTAIKPAKEGFVARLKNIGNRNQAEALGKGLLFVERNSLPDLEEEDSYYHVDLIGLRVLDVDGKEIGEVIRVQNFGAGDLLEVRISERKQAPFVPFTRDAVPLVDLVEGYVQLGPDDLTGL